MQSINKVAVTPPFILVFMGSAVVCAGLAIWAVASLDAVDPHAADAAARWSDYYASWMPLNHVRAVTGIAASGLLAIALRVG